MRVYVCTEPGDFGEWPFSFRAQRDIQKKNVISEIFGWLRKVFFFWAASNTKKTVNQNNRSVDIGKIKTKKKNAVNENNNNNRR